MKSVLTSSRALGQELVKDPDGPGYDDDGAADFSDEVPGLGLRNEPEKEEGHDDDLPDVSRENLLLSVSGWLLTKTQSGLFIWQYTVIEFILTLGGIFDGAGG